MTNKDFLSQFSGGNNKPASFLEEERVKVTKEKKPVNVKLIVIIAVAVLLIGGLVAFLLLRPTIEVKDFVGLNQSEAKAWIKQNEIQTQGIIFKEEYNFEYDEGYIVSQSVDAGKKIRKDAKMDFVVSIGADPDELISVPDIGSMYKDEIQEWIKSNKLQKTKITSSFSDEKEIGEVISYEFKNSDADTFTRSSTLNIVVSKGPQPAGVVAVGDFKGELFSIVEAWGKTNKINIEKVTAYSDKVSLDCVISQSVEAKKEMKEGETLTVVVSLGKGIKVPDFKAMSKTDVNEWIEENQGFVKTREKYSSESAYVLEQSIAAGKYVGEEETLKLTINLGNHFYLDEVLGSAFEGQSYDKIKDKAEEIKELGINIDTHRNYVDSSEPKGTIISIEKIYDKNGTYSEVERLPLTVEITFNISNGDLKDES